MKRLIRWLKEAWGDPVLRRLMTLTILAFFILVVGIVRICLGGELLGWGIVAIIVAVIGWIAGILLIAMWYSQAGRFEQPL